MGLILKVSGQRSGHIKLAWTDDQWDPPAYSVSKELVSRAAANVRAVLNRISEEYLTSPNPDYSQCLSDLIEAGAELSAELFDPVGGDRQTAAQAQDFISDLVFAAKGRPRLTIHSDASVHVPWGFVFAADPETVPERTGTLSDFSGFWLDRFSICTRFNPYNLMQNGARPRDNFRILMALHRSLHESAQQQLAPERREYFENIKNYEVGAVADWGLCRRKWKAIQKQDSILYFYGHSDGSMIELDPGVDPKFRMEALKFHNAFRKHDACSASIFFLNGCLTAMGQEHNGFLRVTAMPGFYGFIGTEAKVPSKFASEYGTDFMHNLCVLGRSVQETYEELRIPHFPLSLLYSCFAHPDFRVEPAPAVYPKKDSPVDPSPCPLTL
jgi:hypothetical protein